METTPEQFIESARALGLDAQEFRSRPGEPRGVNVWRHDSSYTPDATVWWPRTQVPEDQITWGPNFEHAAPRDTPAETLARRVKDSLL